MPTYTMEESVTYLLKNTAAITALVSTRIYPDLAADTAALPYIVWRVESENEEQTFTTPTTGYMRQATIVIGCYADRYSTGTQSCRNIAEAVVTALRNYTGLVVAGGKTVLAVSEVDIGAGADYDSGYDDQRVSREVRLTLWYR